jgi:site-specific DNA recombinase
MRVAIYARYSSENQSEKSIDDQIRVCQKYIDHHNFTCDEKYIYTDEAISGSIINRPGLQALERAMENKEFDAVAVDDLSRLSRSNHQMLTLVNKFAFHQVKIISVSDGIVTDDDNSKLGIHIRGLINELYLDDLKKKTMRGLEGQKLRGYSTGESVFGYKSCPVGELRLNKKGQPKYEGMVHKIQEEEASIVRRIYKNFIEGKSLNGIMKELNESHTPTKKNQKGGWSLSTLSRILKNEKYTGQWIWRKHKNVRDPISGRMKKVDRAKHEQITSFREELVIIDKETWEKAQNRWKDLEGSAPKNRYLEHSKSPFKSYVHTSPNHLLAGILKCKCCGGAMVQISGKGGGYYGCYNNKRKTCANKLLIPRKKVENQILQDLKTKLLTAENLKYVYNNVEKEIAKSLNEVPEELKQKRHQHEKVQAELQNLLNFIKAGNFSKVVSEALTDAEGRSDKLKSEMQGLECQRTNAFKAPPREWIEHRLDNLCETLSKNTKVSALALKDLLGTIEMEPIPGECAIENGQLIQNRAYYIAHTNIETLALLEEIKGSNSYHCRRERDSNPRKVALQRFSRPPQSTALPSLHLDW